MADQYAVEYFRDSVVLEDQHVYLCERLLENLEIHRVSWLYPASHIPTNHVPVPDGRVDLYLVDDVVIIKPDSLFSRREANSAIPVGKLGGDYQMMAARLA